jgi:hypothetical protein
LGKRSFSLLPKAKAIYCVVTAGNLSLFWVGKERKIKIWAKPSNIGLKQPEGLEVNNFSLNEPS